MKNLLQIVTLLTVSLVVTVVTKAPFLKNTPLLAIENVEQDRGDNCYDGPVGR